VPVWGDVVNIKGKTKRLSLIRFSRDAQQMLNFWRSSEAEMLSLQNKAPYLLTTTQVAGHEHKWQSANADNLPYLEYNSDPTAGMPQRQGFASPPMGILQGAENAARDIMDTTGIQEAGLGQKSNETSGRAIMARQAEGDNATFHFMDNAARADRLLGIILVDMIPKIYDTPRVVRTLGLDGVEKMVDINQSFNEKDNWGRSIRKFYDLNAGAYDVVAVSGPSYSTKRQEAVSAMTEILQGNPQLMGIAGDLFVKAMDWPGSEELAERLKKTLPPELRPAEDNEQGGGMPPEVQMQMQQMQEQMQQMDAMIQQQGQQLADKNAELEIKAYEAETKRMAAMKPADAPVTVSATVEPELSEADKIEIETAKAIRLKEMDFEHAERLEMLKCKMAMMKEKMAAGEGDMYEIDDDMNEQPSPMAMAMMQSLQQLSADINALAGQIQSMDAERRAPKSIARDEMGNIVGIGDRAIVRDEMGNLAGIE
jgi:hypothetical protein